MNSIYQTGNAKLDKQIAMSLQKDSLKPNRMVRLMEDNLFAEAGKPTIAVSPKEMRTYKDGTVFASYGEMLRWDVLLKIQSAGEITDLKRQVTFELQEPFINRQWGDVGKLIYVADFTYINISYRKGYENRLCVEDSKGGILTDKYKLKKKLFLYKYGDLLFFEV